MLNNIIKHPRIKYRLKQCRIVDVDPSGRFDKKYGMICNKYYVIHKKSNVVSSGNTEEDAMNNASRYFATVLGIL